MQTLVYQTEVREAITEQGVKPEKTVRIYELTLKADTEADFEVLAGLLQWLKDHAKQQGVPIIEEDGSGLTLKAEAAKNS